MAWFGSQVMGLLGEFGSGSWVMGSPGEFW
uniref:Uncharacterized protein n=1 Tax=Arundo donax TaxID=35708 RepID=A0A0A9C5Q6_ARUDO